MKKSISIFFALYVIIFCVHCLYAEEVKLDHTTLKVYFSPNGGCRDAIIQEIKNAKNEILVQAYSFTSKEIAKALVDAFKRHVKIQVILDQGQRTEKESVASHLAKKGIPVYKALETLRAM
jgi:phosphatidylserine/phosphatidylglycerophosphate/cardiolipin synthase-like enzyme